MAKHQSRRNGVITGRMISLSRFYIINEIYIIIYTRVNISFIIYTSHMEQ